MRRAHLLIGLILWLLARPVLADDEEAKPPSQAPKGATTRVPDASPAPVPGRKQAVRYAPPRRGSPRAKIGGGVRGATTQPRPLTLSPSHVALTSRSAPTLFWYLAAPPRPGVRAVFTLVDRRVIDPLVETKIDLPRAMGIQRLDLAALGVELEVDVEYQWAISMVTDPAQRDLDLVDSSYIMRVSEVEGGRAAGSPASTADWASRSLWHEALESAVTAVETHPADPRPRAELESLLRQAGLHAAVP